MATIKMKVVYSIATKLGKAGLGEVAYNDVSALDKVGYLKKVVVRGNTTDVPSDKILNLWFNPTKVLSLLPRSYYNPIRKMYLDWITSKIVSKGCDAFHGWNNQALLSLKQAKKIGAKTVLWCGSTHKYFRETLLQEEYRIFGIKWQKPWDYAVKRSLQEIDIAHYILVPSMFAYETFVNNGVDKERLRVLPRGVDIKRFSPTHRKENFVVLFVGQISLRKGIHYLLQAWSELRLKDAELCIVGNVKDEIKDLLRNYNSMSSVKLLGFVKRREEIYARASIFVFPSLEEGSAKVTYEAMASGLPVITTPNAGSVVRNGIDGFIVPIRDVETIKEKILYFYENRRERLRMGEIARNHIAGYTWDNYRKMLIDFYKRIMGE